MREEDKTIFEYRMTKEKKYVDMVMEERLLGKGEKVSFFTRYCGYVDGYIYRPDNYDYLTKLPIVFNFHGGGMVLGYCEQDGKYCQRIANKANVAVINVDYPIAPENKYPLPILSSYDFMIQVKANAKRYLLKDDEKISVMGHSAGGYISAALCVLDYREKKVGISTLIADYPVLRQDTNPALRKIIDPKKAISISRMQQYYHWYFNKGDNPAEELASPYNAPEQAFPRTLIISAEYDALRGEEEEFVKKLEKAGREVTYKEFSNCMHGFTHDCFEEYNSSASQEAWNLMANFLKW